MNEDKTKDQVDNQAAKTDSSRFKWAKLGLFFSMVGFAIFICVFGYGYYELAKVNLKLAQSLDQVAMQTKTNHQQIAELQNANRDLNEWSQKSQLLAKQQEEIIAEWRAAQKGDLEKWHLAQVHYLVNLTQDELHFGNNIIKAKLLLGEANQLLQTMQNPDLTELKKALANNLAELTALSVLDVTKIYLTLTELNTQINTLPLPMHALKENNNEMSENKIPTDLSWWKTTVAYLLEALQKIVIVHHSDSYAFPMVFPEEKEFLYQNLHAQLENAMWALLHHNADIYQASLNRAKMWIKQYFVEDDARTKNVLLHLEELQKINVQLEVIDLSATLQLFSNFMAKSNTPPAGK